MLPYTCTCTCRSRTDSISKDSKYSLDEVNSDEEQEHDDMKPSPFRRSSRKSMFLDDGSVWGRWQEKLDNLDFDVSHIHVHVVHIRNSYTTIMYNVYVFVC